MADIFISYARSTAPQAQQVAEALRALGYGVWRDDELPAHRAYGDVIEERLKAAKAVVVIWSAEAARSEWVRSEADRARNDRKLVQLSVDGTALPMPFDQTQCADLSGWTGDLAAPGWRKVIASIADLMGGAPAHAPNVQSERTGISICVLPFANMSNDAEQEYFADGISEDIITDLSKVSALAVIARNSAFTFKGKHVDLLQVAKQLKVSHILEGSVRKSGNRVRITAQLINGATNDHVWAERYDRNLDDIFALQDEISQAIVKALKLKLLPEEKKAIENRGTNNLEAYDLYLRARALHATLAPADVARSIEVYRKALALDPSFAIAWAGLGNAFVQNLVYAPKTVVYAEMEGAFARAFELAPDLPEVNASQAWRSMVHFDWATAAKCVAAWDGRLNDALGIFSYLLLTLGRAQEGAERQAQIVRDDPLSNGASFILQLMLDCAGRLDEAEAEYQRCKDLPGAAVTAEWRAVTRMMARRDPAGVRQRYVEEFGDDRTFMPFRPQLMKVLDKPAEALKVIGAAFDDPACQDGARLGTIAQWAAYYGDIDLALKALRRAFVEMRSTVLPDIWQPVLADVRRDPRFKPIVRDVGLYDYWRASGKWGDFARPVGDDDFEVFR